jgi:hypothetical protein
MNLQRNLKINWWLWMMLSVPPIIYSWLRPREVKGWMISDWGYLMHFLHRTGYTVTGDIWRFFIETLVWSAVPALFLGWIGQYLITLAWDAWRHPKRAEAATS